MKKYSIICSLIITLLVQNIQAQNVGIGTTTPIAKLHVNSGNVVFTGANLTFTGPNVNVPVIGEGVRMMWYPDKAAFRVGAILLNPEIISNPTNYWDTVNIGIASFASGFDTKASGNYSTAMGFGSVASGISSTSLGYLSNASGSYSMALGYSSTASGNSSTASGHSSTASGISSIAMGNATTASGDFSTSMGYFTNASGDFSSAIGFSTDATGDYSTAMGNNTTAFGIRSTAMGNNTTASGDYSTAIGNITNSLGNYSTATGYATDAIGIYSTAMGNNTTASGASSTAMGGITEATGSYSTAMGNFSKAKGYSSTAIGNANLANGFSSFVTGLYNDSLVAAQTAVTTTTPLFIVGNGNSDATRSNAFVVLKNGNVGIGDNGNPVNRLHITGGTSANLSSSTGYITTGFISSTNMAIDNNGLQVRSNGAASDLYVQNSGGNVSIGNTGVPAFQLEITGTAGKPGGSSWSNASDRRLKENILPYSDGLQQLLKIKPVKYHYNATSGYDTKPEYVGIIAQDLQMVAPYMVSTLKKADKEYLSVDNSAMTYMLINAVKEQQQQIEALKAEIELLKKGNK